MTMHDQGSPQDLNPNPNADRRAEAGWPRADLYDRELDGLMMPFPPVIRADHQVPLLNLPADGQTFSSPLITFQTAQPGWRFTSLVDTAKSALHGLLAIVVCCVMAFLMYQTPYSFNSNTGTTQTFQSSPTKSVRSPQYDYKLAPVMPHDGAIPGLPKTARPALPTEFDAPTPSQAYDRALKSATSQSQPRSKIAPPRKVGIPTPAPASPVYRPPGLR